MDGIYIALIAIAVIAAVFIGMALLLPYLAKKGISLPGVVTGANTVLTAAGAIMDGLSGAFPENGTFALIDKIVGYAEQAVKAAEQLYRASKIEADKRNEEAVKLVCGMLEGAGVTLSDDVKRIVNGCIEAAVFALPKTHEGALG